MTMSSVPPARRSNVRRARRTAIAAGLAALLAVVGACGGGDSSPSSKGPPQGPDALVGDLPEAARTIMEKPAYKTSRWIYYVADAETGKVLLANRPDEMTFIGSITKNFAVGAVYDTLGPETRLTTPVYATAPVSDGTVDGDLVLVASGDIALGGRNALEDRFDHTQTADAVDHVYATFTPNAERVGDPLAGLDDLARQVADKGVTRVNGDVVVDTRIWEPFEGSEGPVGPIFVNDNLVDVDVTAAAPGEPATIVVTPETDYVRVTSEVQTVADDGETALEVVPSPDDPLAFTVRGEIAEGTSRLTTAAIPDPAAWARALFIEALERAGIEVNEPATGPNDDSRLPSPDSYPADQQLAELESAPLSVMGTGILEVSHNFGANVFMCLLAVDRGSTNCEDGLKTVYELAEEAGIDTDELFLVDGQGAPPNSTTPRIVTRWMQWSLEQPWGDVFFDGQPVLGETGGLAPYGADSPAAGKVAAKLGTDAKPIYVTGRLYSVVQALGGYITLDDGTVLAYGLMQNGGSFPTPYEGLVEAGTDTAEVSAAFQQALSEQSG